jgi:hypothetical protein
LRQSWVRFGALRVGGAQEVSKVADGAGAELSRDQALAMLGHLLADSLAALWINAEEFKIFKQALPSSSVIVVAVRLRDKVAELANPEQFFGLVRAWLNQCVIRDWLTVEEFQQLAEVCRRLE